MTTIRLTGIPAVGRHGAEPEERARAQEFAIDLEVEVTPASDDISATTDYRDIAHAARRIVDERSFALLETLAAAVAESVRALPGVDRVRATVHKPGAAKSLGADDVSATSAPE